LSSVCRIPWNSAVTYFRNNIKNLITDNDTFTSYANIGRAVTKGIESFISCQALQTLRLRADYTFTRAYDSILNEECCAAQAQGKCRRGMAGNHPSCRRTSVRYVGRWIDGNRDFSIPRLSAGSYTVADIAVQLRSYLPAVAIWTVDQSRRSALRKSGGLPSPQQRRLRGGQPRSSSLGALIRARVILRAGRAENQGFQKSCVMLQMIGHEGLNEIVPVVIARLHAQGKLLSRRRRRGREFFGQQLLVREK